VDAWTQRGPRATGAASPTELSVFSWTDSERRMAAGWVGKQSAFAAAAAYSFKGLQAPTDRRPVAVTRRVDGIQRGLVDADSQ